MSESNLRPKDQPNLKGVFQAAREALIAREFTDGTPVGKQRFCHELLVWIDGERSANILSDGGGVETVKSIEPRGNTVAFSSRAHATELYQSVDLDLTAGATLYDGRGKRIRSLILVR